MLSRDGRSCSYKDMLMLGRDGKSRFELLHGYALDGKGRQEADREPSDLALMLDKGRQES